MALLFSMPLDYSMIYLCFSQVCICCQPECTWSRNMDINIEVKWRRQVKTVHSMNNLCMIQICSILILYKFSIRNKCWQKKMCCYLDCLSWKWKLPRICVFVLVNKDVTCCIVHSCGLFFHCGLWIVDCNVTQITGNIGWIVALWAPVPLLPSVGE